MPRRGGRGDIDMRATLHAEHAIESIDMPDASVATMEQIKEVIASAFKLGYHAGADDGVRVNMAGVRK